MWSFIKKIVETSLVFSLLGCASCPLGHRGGPPGAQEAIAEHGQRVKQLLKEGNHLYTQRDEEGKALAAVKAYEEALALDHLNFEASWKTARLCSWLAEQGGNPQEPWAEKGLSMARKAIQLRPDRVEGHYYCAVNLGLLARKHILTAEKKVDEMIRELEVVTSLEESFDHAGGHRLLGLIYMRSPSWPFGRGDLDEALSHLKRVVDVAPDYPFNHLCLVEAYVKTKRYDEAEKELLFVLGGDGQNPWRKEARELLEKIPHAGSFKGEEGR